MLTPRLRPRVKKLGDGPCFGIEAGYICSLVEITSAARPTQVRFIISATVLFGNRVFEVERQLIAFFREQAVLATAAGSLSNELAYLGLHESARVLVEETAGL